jgi:hypothetical protein
VAVDRTQPPDAQLADYKNLFFNSSTTNNARPMPSVTTPVPMNGSDRGYGQSQAHVRAMNGLSGRESEGRTENSLDGDVD